MEFITNYLEGSLERFIPVVIWFDVLETAKISGDLYAGHVAMSLGMYISERNEGAFKDAFITFNNPALQVISGSLSER
jgi:hypothetical protein